MQSCEQKEKEVSKEIEKEIISESEKPEYFLLRPEVEKVLAHYGCTFDDVVKEDVFTTDMSKFLEFAGYRTEIYKNHFPTGSWLGVKELALPEFMI